MNPRADKVEQLLATPRIILADGATGSELNSRGVSTPLPLWSTAALLDEASREVLRQIHLDYVSAGARILTANTFRTHARNLKAAGLAESAHELTALAVKIARSAAATGQQPVLVAGSHAPLEDCYSPELTPDADALRKEHQLMAASLAAAGVDLILIETMPTIREAAAAAKAAFETGIPFGISFVCDSAGLLLSGESLAEAARQVLPFAPRLLGVNCAPATTLHNSIRAIQAAVYHHDSDRPIDVIAYGNIGEADASIGWKNTAAEQPDVYAKLATDWAELGVKVIGGCCGTTPQHIDALRAALGRCV